MDDSFLPLITIPNDTNESDISLILGSGDKLDASEAMKKYPFLRELLSKKIKLMADKENATIDEPQIKIASLNKKNYASISFFCSKDNYERDTSASIVFAEGQDEEIKNLLNNQKLPESLEKIKSNIQNLVSSFSFWKHMNDEDQEPDLKKKTLFITVFVLIVLGLGILFSNNSEENQTKTNKIDHNDN